MDKDREERGTGKREKIEREKERQRGRPSRVTQR